MRGSKKYANLSAASNHQLTDFYWQRQRLSLGKLPNHDFLSEYRISPDT